MPRCPPYYSKMVKKGQSWEAADPSAYRYCFMFLPRVLHQNTGYVFAQMGTASGHLLSAGPNKLKFISMQTQLNGCYICWSQWEDWRRLYSSCSLILGGLSFQSHRDLNFSHYELSLILFGLILCLVACICKQQSNIRLVLYCWKKRYTCDQTN